MAEAQEHLQQHSNGAAAAVAASGFSLPEHIIAVLPSDPYEQLDLASKITSIALATRLAKLEDEAAGLRAAVADRDNLIGDLRVRIDSLGASLADLSSQLTSAQEEKETLLNENASLSSTVKKLNRDVSKSSRYTARGIRMSNILRKLHGKKKKSSSMPDDSAGPSERQHSPHYENPTTDIAEEDVPHAPQHHSSHDDSILLIDSQRGLTKRRGKATCQDIRDLPPDKRVLIEINDECQPCNVPESTLLASYLGVIAKDCMIAPISFPDWRNSGLEPYKRRMLEEVEAKFSYPPQARTWIRQSLGNKWRAHKTSLKKKYWNKRPLQEIIENVPEGIDPLQLSTIVSRWNEPREKLEIFKKTLMQSLQEEDERPVSDSGKAHMHIKKSSNLSSGSLLGEEDSSNPPLKSSSASETRNAISYEGDSSDVDVSKHISLKSLNLPSHDGTPRLTPPDSPPKLVTGLTPKRLSRPLSPRRHSISAATTRNTFDDRSEIFKSLPPTHSSSMTSPFDTGAQTGRTRVDGKEFFNRVRSRLSYEQFNAFIANLKELNSHKQTREETLRKAGEIFGPTNKDLYTNFDGLINRNLH